MFAPNFTSFSWGDDKPSNITVETPKSDTASVRSSKVSKTSRRRIVRACMRCRLRKTKCDGGKPCTRCTEADDVCEYMKCSKKESKEYSQDYVERLLEQNDKYKTAMRILYANRRLSIQPDNIVIPSTESDDVPLVHDILGRLGMVCKDDDDRSQSSNSESHVEKQKEPTLTKTQTFSAQSIPSPSNSMFSPTFFDESFNMDAPIDSTFFPEINPLALDADMGLTIPYEVYSSMTATKNGTEFSQFSPDFQSQDMDMNGQDWCPLSMLHSVMNGGDLPVDQTWAGYQPSY